MAGTDISDRDLRAMLHITRRYDPVEDHEVLPTELERDLLDLIRCDVLSISGQDSARRSIFAGQGLGEFEDDVAPEGDLFWHHYPDSLPCSYPCRSGDIASVTTTSDFYSDRQARTTGMSVDCTDVFGGLIREMMVCLPVGPAHTRTLRLLFWRGPGSDFTDRDRAVLTLLRPHLCAAYLAARQSRAGRTPLTARQREIMRYVAAGYSNHQIGRRLRLSEGTVRKHLENTFARLGVNSRSAAVACLGPELSAAVTTGDRRAEWEIVHR